MCKGCEIYRSIDLPDELTNGEILTLLHNIVRVYSDTMSNDDLRLIAVDFVNGLQQLALEKELRRALNEEADEAVHQSHWQH